MPTYEVTAPNGRKYRIPGPKGATQAQIQAEVLRQHPDAGSAPQKGWGEQLWDATKNVAAGAIEGAGGGIDAATEAMAGFGRMVARPAARLASSGYRAVGLDNAANRVDSNARQWDQALARPATVSRMVQQVVPVPKDTPGQIARISAGLLGAAAVPATPFARNAPAPQVADDIAALGPEALARAERFSRVGVQKPTTAMVTRNPTAWTRERNLQALTEGQPLKEGLLQVQDDLYNAGQNLSQGAPGRESVGANVRNIVKGRSKRLQQEVSALYTRARETFGDVPVKLDKLWSTMADPGFRNNSKFGHMNDQVTGLLKDFGVIDDVGANIPGKDLTLGQANELRKFIGNLGDGADPTVKAARKMLQTALDTDALGNVGDDAFRAARSAAHARFSEFESGLTSKMAEQKMFDEALPSRIAQGGVSNQQVRDLYKTLAAEGEPGQQAINQLRRQVVADMVNDPRVIMNDGTTVAINGKTLWNNFTKNKDRLKVVLGDDMFRQFDDFVAATRDATVQPALATPNTSNTAAMLLNGKQGLLDQAFAPPDESIGMLARKAPAIGAGLGGLLGYAGGPVSASGGATAGALAGQGVKKIAEQRAAARVAEATQRQIAQSLEPRIAAEALRMLEQTNLDDATRQAIIAKWGHILGIGSAGAGVGLLSAR